MDVEKTEEFLRGIEQSRGVMVASDDDHMTAGGTRNMGEKTIIDFQDPIGRSLPVKDVTGYKQGVNLLLLNNSGQPVKEKGKFLITLLPIEFMA